MGIVIRITFILGILCFHTSSPFPTQSDISGSIYEVDERNSVIKVLESNLNTDVVLEGVDRIRLECSAPYPVQWIYTGTGVPLLLSTIRKESKDKYTASAFITALREDHTGKYECSSAEAPQAVSKYFYIYVPGQVLFISTGGKTIYIPKNDSKIRIPCSVSNPKVSVVLEKSARDVLSPIKTSGKPGSFSYDPKFGFDLDLMDVVEPEGTYVCSAFDNGIRKTAEYTVIYPFSKSANPSNIGAQSAGKGNLTHQCSTHTDCQPNWSCYTDLTCRDPCIHSIRCGKGAICKYNDRRPYCECPLDFVGDPSHECFNTLQGSESGASNPSNNRGHEETTRKTTDCKVNQNCSGNQICLKGQCIDACAVKICNQNSYCVSDVNRIAMCICNPGFTGQNGMDCKPLKFQVEPLSLKLRDAPTKGADACEAGACGNNADCKLLPQGHVECKCKEGYAGNPPKCSPQCQHNRDCPADTVCRTTEGTYPACTELCGARVCGTGAECVKKNGTIDLWIKEESRSCLCKAYHTGNPYVKCQLIATSKDCRVDSDCSRTERCETGATYRKCVDPCTGHRCPFNTECQAVDHLPSCVCPAGSTGSSLLGCTSDVSVPFTQFSSELLLKLEGANSKNCSSLTCGPNSECRLVGGEPSCFCQSNYVGAPPNCKLECESNIDCPADKACIQQKCRNACRNKCGKNARCRVGADISRTPICSCRQGFQGNPNSECTPVRDH